MNKPNKISKILIFLLVVSVAANAWMGVSYYNLYQAKENLYDSYWGKVKSERVDAYNKGREDAQEDTRIAYDEGYADGQNAAYDSYSSESYTESYSDAESYSTDDSESYTEDSGSYTVSPGYAVYITKNGKKYHEGRCSYLRESCIPTSLGDAKANGYGPCSRCNPPQ